MRLRNEFMKRLSFFILILAEIANSASAAPAPTGFRCELLTNPAAAINGICDSSPEFGWIVNSDLTEDRQTAYQIMIATGKSLLDENNPDKWDSGKTISDNSINVSYAGPVLETNTIYYWKVRTWNKNDEPSDWSAVQEFKTGSSFSTYSTSRYKQVVTEVKPVSVTKIADGHYMADFGKDAFGYLRWTIPADQTTANTSEPGASSVELHLGEAIENGLVDRNPRAGSVRYYHTTLRLDGSSEYEIHVGKRDWMPREFGKIGTFRYVELVNSPYPISKEDLTMFCVHNPFDDNAASFVCDNENLNDIWDLCHYSMKETSWCGIFVDGDRERKPYEADAYINQLGYYYADPEYSISRYSHEYLMTHSTWPTEWHQHSIMMAWVDYLYTGNTESLAQYYDQLKNDKLTVSPNSARPSDGLIDPTTTDITDWPEGERDGFVFRPINAVVNAFYYHTLTLMEKIAIVLGKTSDAANFKSEAARIYDSYQKAFYNLDTGLYVDGEGTTHSSLHTNMWALAFDLVPEDKKAAVIDFVRNHRRSETERIACSVYGAQYLLEALYLTGEEDAALKIMTNETPTGWMNMMHEGSTVTMEAWSVAYKPNLDWNHAWGAAPANIIPRFVAGIRPIEPGFKKTLIHPQPATLNSFSIKTPTIRGTILLSMDKQPDSCAFEMTIPANMSVKFVLPKNCDDFSDVTLDGSSVILKQDSSLRYFDAIGSGTHTITAN